MEKRGPGRPPLAEGEKRNVDLRIPLTPDEKAILDRAAGGASLPMAAWARTILMRAAAEVSATPDRRKPRKNR